MIDQVLVNGTWSKIGDWFATRNSLELFGTGVGDFMLLLQCRMHSDRYGDLLLVLMMHMVRKHRRFFLFIFI